LTTKTGIFYATATFTRLYFQLSELYSLAAQRLAELSDTKVLNVVTRSRVIISGGASMITAGSRDLETPESWNRRIELFDELRMLAFAL